MVYSLTKSKYLHGLQCHKRLWYEQNHPCKATPTSKSQQRLIDQGGDVGRLARDHFPEGRLIDAIDPGESVKQTQEAIRSGIPYIFEASFISNGLWVRCDILEKDSNSWKIIEVKASSKVKKEHLPDLAIQKHVLTEQGVTISGTKVMHINRECVYPDLSNLFVTEDVTDQVDPLMADVSNNIETFKAILVEDVEPEIPIGRHCDNPHTCPFKDHCWKDVPEYSISIVPDFMTNTQSELLERDSLSIHDLPDNFQLADREPGYVDNVLNDQPEVDNEAIKNKLSELKYPIYFFDLETSDPAIPRFKGLKPYQKFPFQYSCHILQSNGLLTHEEYLHPDTTDPRLPLVESLIDHISSVGSVAVYNAGFERGVLKDLAEFFPEHSTALRSIISRLWDQLVIFRNHYSHPAFGGSNSLKSVLPVLVPYLSYQGLDIREGNEAQAVWNKMIKTTNEAKKDDMINRLKKYCKLDTFAMVGIHKVLQQVNER